MKRFLGILLPLCLLVTFVAPAAFAADREVTARDLQGINAKRHRYLFSVAGGAAIGAAVGVLVGSGNDVTKGMLIGGGAASTAYVHANRNAGGAWRPWTMLLGHTALGSGLGWTICGCDDGLVAGTLIGAGSSAIWQASQPNRGRPTAQTRP
ncbi:MAG TPA: hypothetical protein VD837_08895 [Terriglobales bacterium]|nr:hypothetical protein [Terriglobales bacterium]